MDDPSARTAQQVLDDHLNLAENWGGEGGFERMLEVDLELNHSKDIVVLINRGTFRGHEGVKQLARMLGEELPEHRSFESTYRAVEGRMAFLEWAYWDANVMVRDGADSYLIEDGKIAEEWSESRGLASLMEHRLQDEAREQERIEHDAAALSLGQTS